MPTDASEEFVKGGMAHFVCRKQGRDTMMLYDWSDSSSDCGDLEYQGP